MPYRESHVLQVRWEVLNVTNSQPFGSLLYATMGQDPFANQPRSTLGPVRRIANAGWREPAGPRDPNSDCGTHFEARERRC
jgi:hypothetical protein